MRERNRIDEKDMMEDENDNSKTSSALLHSTLFSLLSHTFVGIGERNLNRMAHLSD